MTSFELNLKAFLLMESFRASYPNFYYGFRTRANNGRSISSGDFFNGTGDYIVIRLSNDADCIRSFSSVCIYMDTSMKMGLSISYNRRNKSSQIYDSLAIEISAVPGSATETISYNLDIDENSMKEILSKVLVFIADNKNSLLIDKETYQKGKNAIMNSILVQSALSVISKSNLILTGAPGTGKTYLAKEIARAITGDNDENNHPHYEMVQFHPSYDYSDFVEGLRPVKDATGNIGFERKDGVFKAFCKKALKEGYTKTDKGWEYKGVEAPKYVFIIDEINRGEMSKIFGELFFSIDPGYRGTKGRIKTQYQNLVDNEYDEKGQKTNEPDLFADGFFVPKNVYIIGTMNDIDRSVESMDFAMRRRFAFKEVKAIDRIDMWDGEIDLNKQEAGYRMKSLNKAIELIPGLSRAYHIGPSYFLKLKYNGGDFADLWNTHLEGLLFEYLRGMPDAEELRKKLYIVYNDAQDKELSDDDIKKIMGV